MASLRELRRRIKSVDGIRQITRAMEMVSATKLRRAQKRIEEARPYAQTMDHILSRLSEAIIGGLVHHPLMDPREEVNKVLIVAAASQKGLCGSYNANVIRAVVDHAKKLREKIRANQAEKDYKNDDVELLLIGKKLYEFFRKRGWNVNPLSAEFVDIDQTLPSSLLDELTRLCTDGYLDGKYDLVDMVFTQFESAIVHKVTSRQFLPITSIKREFTKDKDEDKKPKSRDYIFEPSPEVLFGILIPKYATIVMLRMLAESLASEHGSRMSSMHNATDNASDMIRTLTLHRNKARQSAITKELAEIVGGAEALSG